MFQVNSCTLKWVNVYEYCFFPSYHSNCLYNGLPIQTIMWEKEKDQEITQQVKLFYHKSNLDCSTP